MSAPLEDVARALQLAGSSGVPTRRRGRSRKTIMGAGLRQDE
eukprot:CAMPEP_0204597300 /NCGR_PEP_ID=MMETSP0661-20131031/53729_1 /ASSEMBLY_ACC=CAM_ASM_000606 /TAXON_ID=109239 /ORGANISM="Alexandrium margalefi, Strain AMGDE01CS-322" /LENGTH=41 /DNA_ID= /DNA_START= /DNA_END= /DNA_ORIENTATION=